MKIYIETKNGVKVWQPAIFLNNLNKLLFILFLILAIISYSNWVKNYNNYLDNLREQAKQENIIY